MRYTVCIAAIGLISGACATDFSSMSMERLRAMQGKVSQSERNAYRAEMQKRMRQKRDKSGYGQRTRQGSGNGKGKMYRKGKGW